MRRLVLAILMLSLPLLAATSRLPVRVTCQTSGSFSTITVRFQAPARDVTITTNPLDDLEMVEPAPITRSQVRAGEEITYQVRHRVGEGPAGLNVSVRGRFSGERMRAGAYAFILREDAPGVPSEDSQGRRVLVVPTGR